MKKIILIIEDDVLKELNTHCNVRAMTGNFGGIADGFIKRLIGKIDDNKNEWHCRYKNKGGNK